MRGAAVVGTALALAVACTGCGSPARQGAPSPGPSASASRPGSPRAVASPSARGSGSCADRTLSRMSLPERVGQLFAVGLAADRLSSSEAAAIRTDHLGSVWFAEKSAAGTAALRRVSAAVQSLATATAGVGFFVGANQEGGTIQSLTGPGFSSMPSAVEQGTMAPSTLRAEAARWGRQLRAAGVNLDFAPVLDVVPPGTDARNHPVGALHREYGHQPATVAAHGVAFQQGMAEAGVAATAKHFPGLGRVAGNTDFAGGVVDRTTTSRDPYLQPFAASIAARVPFVMVSLATYTEIDPDHLAVFSPVVMRQLLRGTLHFDGVVMSDDMGAAAAMARIPASRRGVEFLLAGGDVIVSKTVAPADAMYDAVLSRATSDAGLRHVVDASVLRVLRAKQAAGLLRCG